MRRDYRLYELSTDEFESFVVAVCVKWLGNGVLPFAAGKDGGRDGKFHGLAAAFPNAAAPLQGHFVIQAKHVAAPDKSCSDADFARLLKKEHPKIKRLVAAGLCDHYIVFTNRKLTGGADEKLIAELLKLGVKSAHIIAVEKLHLELDGDAQLRGGLPNNKDEMPFRFNVEDLVEVIEAVSEYVSDTDASGARSAQDFEKLRLAEKNDINGVSDAYYQQIIVERSMPHFVRVEQFLRNPRNDQLRDLYHDAADEMRQKILQHRMKFESFDEVFAYLYEQVQDKRSALRGKRRMVSILLHYMYCNCDIGSKVRSAAGGMS